MNLVEALHQMSNKKNTNKCVSCGTVTTQFSTDDGEYYFAMCGEC